MFFWIIAALLTVGACMAILIPATRRAEPSPAGADIAVYRDQLQELQRDTERGLIGPAEAGEARVEIARRILRIGREARAEAHGGERATRWTIAAAVLAVPLVSWTLYAALGSAGRPSEPLQARLQADPSKSTIQELVARAEARLASRPDDGRGWEVLAPVYLRGGRYADAVNAYRQSIRLNGSSAARETGLGESLAAESGGEIGPDAVAAFRRALAADPGDLKARFFLAAADAQAGRTEQATAAWKAMLAGLPADSQWREPIEHAVAQATQMAAAAPQPGPSPAEVEAASDMSAADRGAMIETMVAELDERLRTKPNDPEGWRRLIRSYLVLGREEAARDALARGEKALGAEAGLAAFAASLGLAGKN